MMSKRKIIVFIDWFYPGYKAGGPIRSCLNMMNHLVDIDFYVVCSDMDYLETTPYANIKYKAWNKIDDNIFVRYLSIEDQNKSNYSEIINSDDFSTIYINGIYSRRFSIMPLQVVKKSNITTIVAVRGMLKESAIAVKKTKKKIFLNVAKMSGLYKNVVFHVTNAAEQEDVQKQISKKAQIFIAPNLPKKNALGNGVVPNKEVGAIKIISLARIAPEKNTLFALESIIGISEVKVELAIFGAKYDETYWKTCQELIEKSPDNVTINYHGVIHPDKIESELQNYHLLFLPTRGENFGHVIIESIMSGTPVLISDQTPWNDLADEGIGFVHNLSNKSAFTDSIIALANQDQQWMNKIHEKCIDYAQKYSNDNVALELNNQLFLSND